MCLRNLFCGDINCTWLLFIIVLILLFDGDCGETNCVARNNGCGCGC